MQNNLHFPKLHVCVHKFMYILSVHFLKYKYMHFHKMDISIISNHSQMNIYS